MSLAFVFPGQGSQSIGMLAELAAEHAIIRSTFAEASSALGYDLWELCQSGPADQLNATERTQPAMLTAGVATWRAWLERGGTQPRVVTGHSLGEFTALVAAGAIDFQQAVRLVAFRGRVMQEAVPAGTGAMAAILGCDDADVVAACAEAAQGAIVEAVNFNSPGQVVIAGETAAVERAGAAAKARGAKRVVLLPVSVPSHSSLMRPAGDQLRRELDRIVWLAPRIEYRSAVDGLAYAEPDALRNLLATQLARPVQWTQTVRGLVDGGAARIVECGPGKVLLGLCQKIVRGTPADCVALDSVASFNAALGQG
jgi:[acyl-carrier-protein] S-malonyltransferase